MPKNLHFTLLTTLGGMSPSDVNKENENELWNSMYISSKKRSPKNYRIKIASSRRSRPLFKYKIGDIVRIPFIRKPFDREFQQKWSEELFRISDRKVFDSMAQYKLSDCADESVHGYFYESELLHVHKSSDYMWPVEKIKGLIEYLVRFRGWPSKFDSWLPSNQVQTK